MVSYRLVLTGLTALGLATLGVLAYAKADTGRSTEKLDDQMAAWATKLGLSDQQKDQVRTICADFRQRSEPVEEQLWKQLHDEMGAMKGAMTEEQRAKLPEIIKSEINKECQTIADKLSLSEEQKQKIGKIREEYEPKFHELCSQSTEGARKKIHELKADFFAAIRKELNDDQRAKFCCVLREEFCQWRDPMARHNRMEEIANQLGVNADEKTQLKKVRAEYKSKTDELATKLKDMYREERAALEKVLTEEQRGKMQEMWKGLGVTSAPTSKE
jgi:Spy/CpxP family protein refolding chaperone